MSGWPGRPRCPGCNCPLAPDGRDPGCRQQCRRNSPGRSRYGVVITLRHNRWLRRPRDIRGLGGICNRRYGCRACTERIVLRLVEPCARPPLAGMAVSSEAAAAALRDVMVIASGTWSTTGVNALLAGLIGVGATLLGSFTTYLFQSRTAERAQAFERSERVRYEQVNACSAFASAMTELKRGLITLWFYHQRDAAGADYAASRIECDRLGASAEAARFRVQLVSGDPEVEMLANAVFTAVGALSSSSDRDELRERENHFEAAVTTFIHAASGRFRTTVPASTPGRPGQDAPASAR